MRHDAYASRQHQKSELVRASLGIHTPQEIEAMQSAERKRRAKEAARATKGTALFGEGE